MGISIRFQASRKAKLSRLDLADKNMVLIVVQYLAEILLGLHRQIEFALSRPAIDIYHITNIYILSVLQGKAQILTRCLVACASPLVILSIARPVLITKTSSCGAIGIHLPSDGLCTSRPPTLS